MQPKIRKLFEKSPFLSGPLCGVQSAAHCFQVLRSSGNKPTRHIDRGPQKSSEAPRTFGHPIFINEGFRNPGVPNMIRLIELLRAVPKDLQFL